MDPFPSRGSLVFQPEQPVRQGLQSSFVTTGYYLHQFNNSSSTSLSKDTTQSLLKKWACCWGYPEESRFHIPHRALLDGLHPLPLCMRLQVVLILPTPKSLTPKHCPHQHVLSGQEVDAEAPHLPPLFLALPQPMLPGRPAPGPIPPARGHTDPSGTQGPRHPRRFPLRL